MTEKRKPTRKRRTDRGTRMAWARAVLLVLRCLACAGAAAVLVFVGSVFMPGRVVQGGKRDTQAPILSGVQDRQVYVGDTVAYREGITVLDAVDPEPVLTVDSSAVDLTTPGEYPVTYSATDASGNKTTAQAIVTVQELPQSWIPPQTIEDAIGVLIDGLGLEEMDTQEQVQTIYDWAHANLKYSGHTDRENVRQAAYQMLTTRQGDCYGFYALTKVLFDALEIPNLDVEKVRNFPEDSDHFWSLVSVDGGESYYHFDATPRVGQTISFCLITDEELDAYSAANKNSHNRDAAAYPATPKEALP